MSYPVAKNIKINILKTLFAWRVKMNRVFILFIVLFLQLNLFAACEREESLDSINTIKLKDGTELKGEIISSTDKSIKVILEKGKRIEVKNSRLIIEEAASFMEGYAPVKIGGKWGYLDKKGSFAIVPKFDEAWNFSESLAVVKVNNKYGIIDSAGKYLIHPQYKFVTGYYEGLCGVYFNDKMVFLDTTGKIVLDKNFDFVYPFSGGRAAVRVNGIWGIIDKQGEYVVEPYFDEIKNFKEGLAAVKKGEKWGYMDRSGRIIIAPQYFIAGEFSEGVACAVVKENWKDPYSILINKDGEKVTDYQFFVAGPVRDGLAVVVKMKRHFYIIKEYKSAFWDVIKNKPLTGFIFNDASVFTECLAPVRVGYEWGYIDTKGKMKIEPQFDDYTNFSEGLAAVSKGNRWGYINKSGNSMFGFLD